jgi:glycosyltransferase involved in cell wall biosynthesis
MNLAIILPARNEEDCIAGTLLRIPAGLAGQIIVVDNGSTDRTADRARQAGGVEVVAEPRRGYGRACLTGLARLRDEIDAVAVLDADGADDSRNLTAMLALIGQGEADLVLSARRLGDARDNLSVPQRFGNWLACTLIRWLWGYRYSDLGPMRVIRRDALQRLEMTDPTWGWNVEMQVKAIERGLRIREVPVTYGKRVAGRSKISGSVTGTVRAGAKILGTIGRLWWSS